VYSRGTTFWIWILSSTEKGAEESKYHLTGITWQVGTSWQGLFVLREQRRSATRASSGRASHHELLDGDYGGHLELPSARFRSICATTKVAGVYSLRKQLGYMRQ
jgi:hypothetical protein